MTIAAVFRQFSVFGGPCAGSDMYAERRVHKDDATMMVMKYQTEQRKHTGLDQ